MIPVFFAAETLWGNTGEYNLDKMGVRQLVDAVSCIVTKDTDGIFELTIELPISGKEMPTYDSIIIVDCGMAEPQRFSVYRIEKFLSSHTMIFTAWHISHINNYDIVKDLKLNTNTYTVSKGLEHITERIIYANYFGVGYLFKSTNDAIPSRGTFESGVSSARDVVNAYAELTGFHVIYNNEGGTFTDENPDHGVVFTTNKNIMELSSEIDVSEIVTGYCPYNSDGGELNYGKIYTVANSPYAYNRIVPYNINDHDIPEGIVVDDYTRDLIMENALKYLELDIVENITLDTVELGGNYVDVYDLVTINCLELGISVKKVVVATEYDVLAHRLITAQFGTAKPDIAKTIALGTSTSREIGTGRKI